MGAGAYKVFVLSHTKRAVSIPFRLLFHALFWNFTLNAARFHFIKYCVYVCVSVYRQIESRCSFHLHAGDSSCPDLDESL